MSEVRSRRKRAKKPKPEEEEGPGDERREKRVEGWSRGRGAGDKQPSGFHGSTRRAKSALISGSRACRKRGDARRTAYRGRSEVDGHRKKGTERNKKKQARAKRPRGKKEKRRSRW